MFWNPLSAISWMRMLFLIEFFFERKSYNLMSVEGYYEGEREFRHLLNWDAKFLGCFFSLHVPHLFWTNFLWVFLQTLFHSFYIGNCCLLKWSWGVCKNSSWLNQVFIINNIPQNDNSKWVFCWKDWWFRAFFFSFWSDGEKLESPLIGSLDLMETYSYIKHIAYKVKVKGLLKFTSKMNVFIVSRWI